MKKHMKRENSYRYLIGKRIIESSRSNKDLFEFIQAECPNVDEGRLIELFVSAGGGIKNVTQAILATAHMMEYNYKYPYKSDPYWFSKFLPRGVSPEKVANDKQLMDKLIDLISKTEVEWDDKAGAPKEEIKKRVRGLFKKERATVFK
jgi:hypothetical protein